MMAIFWLIIRGLIALVLFIGLPYFIYLAFIEDEPLMEPSYDVEMGQSVVESFKEDPDEYPVLSPEEYPEAYAYMQDMVDEIVASSHVQYKDVFAYDQVRIIARDDVLNAFCTPGGFIYVYSGLIKYLDAPDHLAGVLGHEIAHAELRHSSVRMQKEYGKDKLMDFLIFATPATLTTVIHAQIVKDLTTLDYSRDQEADSDTFSVKYLQDTQYACNGAAGFFEKLLEAGNDVKIPEFLSDHPASYKRVRDINEFAEELQCDTSLSPQQSEWQAFQKMLPDAPVPKAQPTESEQVVEQDEQSI